MPSRMMVWTGAVSVGCALTAAAMLPPRNFIPEPRVRMPEEVREQELRDEVYHAAGTLQRMRWGNQFVPQALAAEGRIAWAAPEWVKESDLRAFRYRLDAELDRDPPSTDSVALGWFLVDQRSSAYPGTGAPTEGEEYYFGEGGGHPYCVVARTTFRSEHFDIQWFLPDPLRSAFGVCHLIARHGLPGPTVEAWLVGGGTALAASIDPRHASSTGHLSSIPTVFHDPFLGPSGPDVESPSTGLFGRRSYVTFSRLLGEEACTSGIAAGCALMIEKPVPWGRSRTGVDGYIIEHSPLSAVQELSMFAPVDFHVAADLASEFGEERFQRFWTSDAPLAEAFESAFGEDMGEWNLRRVSGLVEMRQAGPGVRAGEGLTAFLLFALSAVIAGAWARRRRVA